MNELQELILKGECDTLDFKQRIKHADRIARTIVSFANTRGGIILVGVRDDGCILGIDPEEEIYTLQQAADFYCDPPVPLFFEEVDFEGKTVLLVHISESNFKPHFAKVKDNDWRGYIRVKDTSVQTSKLVNQSLATETILEQVHDFDPIENALFDYLQKKSRITLKEYMNLVNISRRRAYRILVKLVLHGYLRLHDKNKEDYYTLS